MFQTEIVVKIKINFFFNLTVYEAMWKHFVEPDWPRITIWRMRTACWIPKGYKDTLRICNTYCLPTTTMVA